MKPELVSILDTQGSLAVRGSFVNAGGNCLFCSFFFTKNTRPKPRHQSRQWSAQYALSGSTQLFEESTASEESIWTVSGVICFFYQRGLHGCT